ncbi:MAG: hypothetical protein AAGE18_03105 [Pseudomonadota bacterium]
MRVVYSCVVDGKPKFAMQAFNLVLSLRAVGVRPENILVNLTPAAACYDPWFAEIGVQTAPTPYFADGTYCNKVAQLRNIPEDADIAVCCDTDLVFARNIEARLRESPDRILGKVVDFANPPIERLRAALALVLPDTEFAETRADIEDAPTLEGNLNGGLYIIPRLHLNAISTAWEAHAQALHAHPETKRVLGSFAWHIDQIAFCAALRQLDLTAESLPIEYNYPLHCHLPPEREEMVGTVRIFHVHDAVDENWLPVASRARTPAVREQVAALITNLRALWCMVGEAERGVRTEARHFTFIMGFHRSGTSLMTAGCEKLGFSVGSGPLFGSDVGNPKGYFENTTFVRLNEEIMRTLDSEWDDIFFSFDGRQAEICDTFLLPIQRFLEQEFMLGRSRHYVLKDPRAMQTYGIWRGAFARLEMASPRIILLVRNPLECAESQARRYRRFYEGKGDIVHFFGRELLETCLLWYSYNMRLLSTLADEPAIVVRHGDLIEHPGETIARIGAWADMEPCPKAIDEFARAFLDRNLRHHSKTFEELREATQLFPHIAELYRQLDALGRDGAAAPREIRRIVEDHAEPYADLLSHSVLGRLHAVPRLKWQQERWHRTRARPAREG